jgi:HEAT repeat protein
MGCYRKKTTAWLTFLFWVPAIMAQDLPALLSRFESEHETEAQTQVLRDIGRNYRETAGPGLFEIALRTKDAQTKWLAIGALGELKFQKAAPFTIRCLQDDNLKVRRVSAISLSEIKDSSSIPALIELLKDEHDAEVVRWTAGALAFQGAKSAVPVLKSRANDGPTETRMAIISSIGILGGRDEVPYLVSFLDDKDAFVAITAARMIEGFAGEDFDWCGKDPCGMEERIRKVKTWWRVHDSTWK